MRQFVHHYKYTCAVFAIAAIAAAVLWGCRSADSGTEKTAAAAAAAADSIPQADTLAAFEYFTKAKVFQKETVYDSSTIFFELAKQEYIRTESHNSYMKCMNELGYNLWYTGKTAAAQDTLKKGLRLFGELELHKSAALAHILKNLGVTYKRQGKLDSALSVYDSSLAVCNTTLPANTRLIGALYINIAGVYNRLGYYEEALASLNLAQDFYVVNAYTNSMEYAGMLVHFAIQLYVRGNLIESEQYLDEAASLITSLNANHPLLSDVHTYLGVVHRYRGDYGRAVRYHQKALTDKTKQLGPTNIRVAREHSHLGESYFMMGEYVKSIDSFNRQLQIISPRSKTQTRSMMSVHGNLAKSYKALGEYDQAKAHIDDALEFSASAPGKFARQRAALLKIKGELLRAHQSHRLALRYFEQARELMTETLGSHHQEVSKILIQISDVHLRTNSISAALKTAHSAVAASAPQFTNPLELSFPRAHEFFMEDHTVEALAHKARVLSTKYESTDSSQYLFAAIRGFELTLEVANELRTKSLTEESLLLISDQIHMVYEQCVKLAWKAFKLTGSKEWLNRVFELADESKAFVLRTKLNKSLALHSEEVGDSIRALERSLRASMAFYTNKLNQAPEADPRDLEYWRDQLFNFNAQYDSLTSYLERKHPEYYRRKYEYVKTNLKDVQDKLAAEDQSIVEYFLSDEINLCFVINIDSIHAIQIDRYNEELIASDNRAIQSRLFSTADGLQFSSELYTIFFAPIASLLKEKVLVVPDGFLAYVPFECLAIPESSPGNQIGTQEYIVQRFALRYSPSCSVTMVNADQTQTNLRQNLTGFAPLHFE